MFEKLREWLRLQMDAEKLYALDNRLLADMGFEREFIDVSVATGVRVTARMLAERREGAEVTAAEDDGRPSACGPLLAHYAGAGR